MEILVIILLVWIISLQVRVNGLEKTVREIFPGTKIKTDPAQQSLVSAATGNPTIDSLYQPGPIAKFFAWCSEEWILKLGALFALIGFGWLANYAFSNGIIGPAGRITLGILAGVAFIILGWVRLQKYLQQGSIFLVLGSTIILLTTFAARTFYDFFTPASALGLMFLSSAFVALVSLKHKSYSLALAGLILSAIAPLFTYSPAPDHLGLFSYLLVVTIGSLWISFLNGGQKLTLAAVIIISCYSAALFHAPDHEILLIFAYIFAAIFFAATAGSILKSPAGKISSDLFAAAGSGLLLLAWICFAADKDLASLTIIAWATLFVIGAFWIFKQSGRIEPFFTYAGVAAAMIAVATSFELEGGNNLTIAYTIESIAAIIVSHLITRDVGISKRVSAILIGPVLLSLTVIIHFTFFSNSMGSDIAAIAAIAFGLIILGTFFWRQNQQVFAGTFFIGGSIYLYILLWWITHQLFSEMVAVMISMSTYTIVGLITYLSRYNAVRIYGALLIGAVVLRLFFVEVWRLDLGNRIVIFFLIGALLMSTAFLRRKK